MFTKKTILMFSILVLFSGFALAENDLQAECERLATDFAAGSTSLDVKQLEQLKNCVSHALAQHVDTDAPEPPTGVIVTQPSSTTIPDTMPPKAPTGVILHTQPPSSQEESDDTPPATPQGLIVR